eukprot:COSAG04_NODE_1827_length_5473_cov_15.546706_2_plen_102_part_00
MFLGFVLFCLCIYPGLNPSGALIVAGFTAAGTCLYRRKMAKPKKQWQKKRDPIAYKQNKKKGMKGKLKKAIPGKGGGGGGESHMGGDMKRSIAMAKMASKV